MRPRKNGAQGSVFSWSGLGENAVSTGGLGLIEGGIGALRDAFDGVFRTAPGGEAEAHGGGLFDTFWRVRSVERGKAHGFHGVADTVGDDGCGFGVGAWKKDDELFSSPATEDVDAADGVLHRLHNGDERGIAAVVAEEIVDSLEVIEIEDQKREGNQRALALCDLAVAPLQEGAAVVDAREGVCTGEMFQLVGKLGRGEPEEAEGETESGEDEEDVDRVGIDVEAGGWLDQPQEGGCSTDQIQNAEAGQKDDIEPDRSGEDARLRLTREEERRLRELRGDQNADDQDAKLRSGHQV